MNTDRAAVAKALHEIDCTRCRMGWTCGGIGVEDEARADALLSRLPAGVVVDAAAIWDRGYTSGHSNAMRRMSDEPNVPTTPNPYRKEAE